MPPRAHAYHTAPSWAKLVDKLWHFVVGSTGFVLFSEHLPLLRLNLLFLRLPPSVRPPLFTHISISLFFHGSVASSAHVPGMLLYLPPHPKHTYYYYSRPCAHMFFLYIYMYTYYYLLLPRIYIHIYMNTLPHARTHTHTLYFYMCTRIYTHIYYIIVLYVSEKERPVDYGRSAFLMSE